MKDLVDMLVMFMLQVVEKDGNLYPRGWKHNMVSYLQQWSIYFKSPYRNVFEIGLKYEYLHETEINIFFHFQSHVTILSFIFLKSKKIIFQNNHSWCLNF
jgi:hypothetical protein